MTNTLNPQAVNPAISVFETHEEICIIADLPGVKKEDLELQILDRSLHILAKIHSEGLEQSRTQEVFWKELRRSISLGERADPNAVEAKLEHGVLTVTVGKLESARPRKIQIQ